MPSPVEQLLGIEGVPPLVEEKGGGRSGPDRDAPAVVCLAGDGPPQWLRGAHCTVLARPTDSAGDGTTFAQFGTDDGSVLDCLDDGDGRVRVPFSFTEAYEAFTFERWTNSTSGPRLSSAQLNAYYRVKRLIPRPVQLLARRQLIKRQGSPAFPRWPYDNSVERLVKFYAACALRACGRKEAPFRWFWPNGAQAAAMLTHDVEGTAGLNNALRIARLEEERGFRSSFNIVGRWYPIDDGILRELTSRGHEIGSHAVYHDRSLFSSRATFEEQLPVLRETVSRLGASGFRSPATHRVDEWLAELPVDYDATIPMSDPYEPQPGGACTVWPFFIGSVVELPYTLPQDHTLFTLIGERSPSVWVEQVRRLKCSAGLVQCLSHPDPGYLGDRRKETLYCDFLDMLREEPGIWHALPRDVARWWRARSNNQSLPGLSLGAGTAVLEDTMDVEFRRPPADGPSCA